MPGFLARPLVKRFHEKMLIETYLEPLNRIFQEEYEKGVPLQAGPAESIADSSDGDEEIAAIVNFPMSP